MKKVLLIPAVVLALLFSGCKPEQRWLRVYNDGEFKDYIDITGWEKNEDVVQLGPFYYPWQGEDSIDYRCCTYFEGKKCDSEIYKTPGDLLEVNGKVVGVLLPCYDTFPDSNGILTLIYLDPIIDTPPYNYNMKVLERFPDLVGVTIYVRKNDEMARLDSVPKGLRVYFESPHLPSMSLRRLSRYPNIRVLDIYGWYTKKSLRPLLRMRNLRVVRTAETNYFIDRKWLFFPKLTRIEDNEFYLY